MNVRCPSCEAVYRVDPAKVPQVGIRARCGSCAAVIAIQAPNTSPVTKTEVGLETAPAPTGGPELVRDQSPEPPTQPAPPPSAPRLSRPFTQPRPDIGGAPSPSPVPPRPSAPVFRPTPGMPITQPVAPERPPPPPPEPDVPATTTAVEPEPSPVQPAELAAPAPAPTAAPTPATTQPRRPVNPFLSKDPSQKARRLARALVSDMIVYQPKKRQDALHDGNLKTAFEEEIKKSWGEYVVQVGEDVANSTPYFTEALNDILAGGQKIF